jgi:hypothetical protein
MLLGVTATLALALAGCGSSNKSSSSTTSSSTAATAPTSTAQQTPAATAGTGAATASSRSVTAASGAITATMHGGTHEPRVEQAWPLHFTVTRGGRPVKASVAYEYLFSGQVVAHRSHYTFTGHFSDLFHWPSSAVGYPLTFRAVITASGTTINLDYPVKVIR